MRDARPTGTLRKKNRIQLSFFQRSCQMKMLLTNDDGIHAVGLRAIYAALTEAGHTVHVVAPMTEQSAVGHSLTVFQPLRVKEIRETGFEGLGVHGTPTDCVKLALSQLLPEPPDMVISGINAGPNVGPDILYSGTVAAATEAAHSGFPAMAVSYDGFRPADLSEQARHAAALAPRLAWKRLPPRCVINVNYPDRPMANTRPLRICPQTTAVWKDDYDERLDPRGSRYWWLTGVIPPEQVNAASDRALLSKGHITMTPLRFDFTDRESLATLEDMNLASLQ